MASAGHDLERFVQAQDKGGTYQQALAELRAGRKTGHWMWFDPDEAVAAGLRVVMDRCPAIALRGLAA